MAGIVALDPALSSHTRLPSCTEQADFVKTPDGGYSYEVGVPIPLPATLISKADMIKSSANDSPHQAVLIHDDLLKTRLQKTAEVAASYAIEDAANAALPAIDLPTKNPPKALVIFFSGDGGWRDIDMEIGQWLQQHDVYVIGVDSLRYFWKKRSPQEMSHDIAKLIDKSDPAHKLPVSLFGYSFGADAIPFAWPLLDERLQKRIRMIALMGVSTSADFEISIDGWLGGSGTLDELQQLQKMPRDKTLCIYGAEEDDTSCPSPILAPMQRIKLPGGHHFDEDYHKLAAQLYAVLLDKIKNRALSE